MGKSTGQLVGAIAGGIIGGVAGYFISNPLLGASLGMSIGQGIGGMIDPPRTDLVDPGKVAFTINTYHRNLPVPIVYGIARVGGNFIWMGDIRSESQTSGGGKGKPAVTKIFYLAKWALCLSEGTCEAVGRIWLNEQEAKLLPSGGKAVIDVLTTPPGEIGEGSWNPTIDQVLTPLIAGGPLSALTVGEEGLQIDFKLYPGDQLQVADVDIARLSSPNPPAFRNTCYSLVNARIEGFPSVPQISVELAGINTQIAGVGVQVCFFGWPDPANWTKDAHGTMTRGATGSPLHIVDSSPGSAPSVAYSKATAISIDLNGDFDLRFGMYGSFVILETAWNARGFAILRNGGFVSDGTWVSFVTGHVSPPQGWRSTVSFTGAIPGGSNFTIYDTPCPGGNCTGSDPGRGDPAHANMWVRANKRTVAGVHTVNSFLAHAISIVDPQNPSPDTPLSAGWVPAATNPNTFTQGLIDASNPFGFALCSTLTTINLPSTSGPPSFFYDLFFCYKSAIAIGIAQRGNPALAVYDFLTNERYGMGIATACLDTESFGNSAVFCDEPIGKGTPTPIVAPTELKDDLLFDDPPTIFQPTAPDPLNPYERRFTLDIAITGKRQAADILQQMLATFRGFLVWEGGIIFLFIEKNEPPVQAFADDAGAVGIEGLMVMNSFSFMEIDSRERANRIKLEYERFDDMYRPDFAVANDQFDQEERGEIIEKVIILNGIKRTSQANRMVQYFLDLSVNTRWTCSFTVSIAAMKARVGDIITVTHALPGFVAKLFRIVKIDELEHEELKIDAIQYIPDVYNDQETDIIIPITEPLIGDFFLLPPNAIRVGCFEARDDATRQFYITWSLPTWYTLFINAFLFIDRKEGQGFEFLGNFGPNAVTAYISHFARGFALETTKSLGLLVDHNWENTLTALTAFLQHNSTANTGTGLAIVSNELQLNANEKVFCHVVRNTIPGPSDVGTRKFRLPDKFEIIAWFLTPSADGGGSETAPGISIMWDKTNWVQFLNDFAQDNLRASKRVQGVLTHKVGATVSGDTDFKAFKILVTDKKIVWTWSEVTTVVWNDFREEPNFKSGVRPIVTASVAFGKSIALLTAADSWDHDGAPVGSVATTRVDNICVRTVGDILDLQQFANLNAWTQHKGNGTLDVDGARFRMNQVGQDAYGHIQLSTHALGESFEITCRISLDTVDALRSGRDHGPGIFVSWAEDGGDWIGLINAADDNNIRIREFTNNVEVVTTPDGLTNGDDVARWYRIRVDTDNINYYLSTDGIAWTQKRRVVRDARFAGPPREWMIGKGEMSRSAEPNPHWDNGASGTAGDSFIDEVYFINLNETFRETGYIEIQGDVIGMAARFFDAGDVQRAEGKENDLPFDGGVGVHVAGIFLDISDQTDPFIGYIKLFKDGTFTELVARFPATGTQSFAHDDLYSYKTSTVTPTTDPTTVRIQQLINAMPSTGEIQVNKNEGAFTGFISDDQGDRLTGVTWPLEKTIVTLDNRLINPRDDVKIWVETAVGVYLDVTTEFLAFTASQAVFTANALSMFIGATTKFQALHFVLSLLGIPSATPIFTYSFDDAGNYTPFTGGQGDPVVTVGANESPNQVAHLDNTLGFTVDESIFFEPFKDWALTDKDDFAQPFPDTTKRFYVHIKRTTTTLTTDPKVKGVAIEGIQFLTIQDEEQRVEYPYLDDETSNLLTFEPMMQNAFGATALVSRRNSCSLVPSQFADLAEAVANGEIFKQNNNLFFMGGDLEINWLYVSKVTGAGRLPGGAGGDFDGAGADPIADIGFQKYLIQFFTSDKVTLLKQQSVSFSDGVEQFVFTQVARDLLEPLGLSMYIRIFNKSNGLFSQSFDLEVTKGNIGDVGNIGDLLKFGDVYVPLMSEITDFSVIEGLGKDIGAVTVGGSAL